jgi:acetoin:2,6-dichlorophenolindophenol oxidoreductase subunit alpha
LRTTVVVGSIGRIDIERVFYVKALLAAVQAAGSRMDQVNISDGDAAQRKSLFRWLCLARSLDRALCELNERWFPAEGEEAVIVGCFCDLRLSDIVAPHYRDPFVVYLMRGANLVRLVAQVIGKSAGYGKGRPVPFTGPVEMNVVPWVAGDLGTSVGVATGAAFALQNQHSDNVVVCTFGDGTANRGDIHESINLASLWRLPIIYVCQNNRWAISQSSDTYLPAPIAARAAGYGIPGCDVDGQDLDAVRAVVGAAVERARAGAGPTLVEALTIRARGHWAGDQAGYRQRRAAPDTPDPLELYWSRLVNDRVVSYRELGDIVTEVERTVTAAVEAAVDLPDPTRDDVGIGEVFA